jgi:hypothetical protein
LYFIGLQIRAAYSFSDHLGWDFPAIDSMSPRQPFGAVSDRIAQYDLEE